MKLSIHTVYVSLFNTKQFVAALKYSLLVFLMAWSMTYYIHSSELWSVYISKNTFNFDFFSSISIKPLFHFVLYLFHQLPLSDVQHLYLVKFFFSLIAVLQFFLLTEIFKRSLPENDSSKKLKQILFSLFIFSSLIYLQNFFRIRTDQVCITLFLFFIHSHQKKRMPFYTQLIFIGLYPLIGLKGFIFSLLHGLHLITIYKKNIFQKKYVLFQILTLTAILIWTINISWAGVLYFISTTQNFSDSVSVFFAWFKADFFLIMTSFVSIFNLNYQSQFEKKVNINLSLMTTASLILIFLFPQKHSYFIASFVPLFLLNSSTFINYLFEKYMRTKNQKIIFITTIIVFISYQYSLYIKQNPYRSNAYQMQFINYAASLISLNNLSYIDGFGALPRAKNLNCFVSPSDDFTNKTCLDLVASGQPDVVILTQRLMWLIGPTENLKQHYKDVGYNIFVKKDLDFKFQAPEGMMPGLLVFGFEQ